MRQYYEKREDVRPSLAFCTLFSFFAGEMPLRLMGLLFAIAVAQEAEVRLPNHRRPVIKIFPLALVDPFQYTLHMGLELPTSWQNSIQIEGGWVFGHLGENLGTQTTAEEFQQTGFKARLQWREYFSPIKSSDRPIYTLTGGYIGLIGGYQHYNQNIGYIDTAGVYYPPSQPVITGAPYERRIQAYMGGFIMGYQSEIGSRLVFDVYTGLAVRYAVHDWKPIKPPYNYRFTPIGDLIVRRGGRPIVLMGFSMGWILR